MSQWAYYAPAVLGSLAALIYALFGRGDFTQTQRAMFAAIGAPAAALICQLITFAAQAIFAGVLPVPWGKTLRGRKCAVIGVLLIVGMAKGGVAYLAMRTGTARVALGAGLAGAACWLTALVIYGWSLPTATADFGSAEPS